MNYIVICTRFKDRTEFFEVYRFYKGACMYSVPISYRGSSSVSFMDEMTFNLMYPELRIWERIGAYYTCWFKYPKSD